MKTKGKKINRAHRKPTKKGHVEDGILQELAKARINAGRERRAEQRKAHVKLTTAERMEEAPVPPKDQLKHPAFGLGATYFDWSVIPGHEHEAGFVEYGSGVSDDPFYDAYHDAYSGWREPRSGKVRFYDFDDRVDDSYYEGTLTVPDFMGRTLSGAQHAGEATEAEVTALNMRIMDRLASEGLAHRASGGAQDEWVLLGFSLDPQEGVVHWHPLFSQSKPLLWRKADGTLVPRSEAPVRKGRPKAGEGWVGGEPCGIRRESDGRWDGHEVGPGGVGADAFKEAGFPPNPDRALGEQPWAFLDKVVAWRQKDMVKGACEPDGTPLLPYDIWGSRLIREEIKAFCDARPAVKKRWEAERAIDYRRYCAKLGIEASEDLEKRQELERELEAAKEEAKQAGIEKAGAEMRVRDIKERTATKVEQAQAQSVRLAKRVLLGLTRAVNWLLTTQKPQPRAVVPASSISDYVGKSQAHAWGWGPSKMFTDELELCQSVLAASALKPLEQQLTTFKQQDFCGIMVDGIHITAEEAVDALERLRARASKGTDDFLLNQFGAVKVEVVRRCKYLAEHAPAYTANFAKQAVHLAEAFDEGRKEVSKIETVEEVRKQHAPEVEPKR